MATHLSCLGYIFEYSKHLNLVPLHRVQLHDVKTWSELHLRNRKRIIANVVFCPAWLWFVQLFDRQASKLSQPDLLPVVPTVLYW